MTDTPGDDQPSRDPSHTPPHQDQPPGQQPPGQDRPPGQEEQAGYWEQRSRQDQSAPPQGYGYPPPPGAYPQAPIQYAPDHPKATTVLVLGIIGVVLCQVLGPFAWVMGKRTLAEIDASQGRVGGRGAAQAGYVLGIIGTVLLAISVVILVAYLLFAIALVGGGIATSP